MILSTSTVSERRSPPTHTLGCPRLFTSALCLGQLILTVRNAVQLERAARVGVRRPCLFHRARGDLRSARRPARQYKPSSSPSSMSCRWSQKFSDTGGGGRVEARTSAEPAFFSGRACRAGHTVLSSVTMPARKKGSPRTARSKAPAPAAPAADGSEAVPESVHLSWRALQASLTRALPPVFTTDGRYVASSGETAPR